MHAVTKSRREAQALATALVALLPASEQQVSASADTQIGNTRSEPCFKFMHLGNGGCLTSTNFIDQRTHDLFFCVITHGLAWFCSMLMQANWRGDVYAQTGLGDKTAIRALLQKPVVGKMLLRSSVQ